MPRLLFLLLASLALLISHAGGWPVAGMAASVAVFLGAAGTLLRRATVRVPGEQMAVVVDRDKDAFVRLLPPGVHRVRPFLEAVDGLLPLGTETTAAASQLYSDGGVPLRVHWEAAYQLEPARLPPAELARLARRLARAHKRLVAGEVSSALQHAMSTLTIGELFAGGGRGRLERLVRGIGAERLTPLGAVLKRVRLLTIDLPPDVADALAGAQERAVQVESQAHALARLQSVIGAFTDQDMARLTELERLRLLGQHGLAYGWPLPAVIDVPPAGPGPDPPARPLAAPRPRAAGVPAAT